MNGKASIVELKVSILKLLNYAFDVLSGVEYLILVIAVADENYCLICITQDQPFNITETGAPFDHLII